MPIRRLNFHRFPLRPVRPRRPFGNLHLLPGLDLASTRQLAAVTDDPLLIIGAAIAEARQARQDGDDLLMRQAAEKGWLAMASLGDVASHRLGLGTPHGTGKRIAALVELEELMRLRRGPYSSAALEAHNWLHGRVFHEADPQGLAQVLDDLEALKKVIAEALARLPEAVRRKRAQRGRR